MREQRGNQPQQNFIFWVILQALCVQGSSSEPIACKDLGVNTRMTCAKAKELSADILST